MFHKIFEVFPKQDLSKNVDEFMHKYYEGTERNFNNFPSLFKILIDKKCATLFTDLDEMNIADNAKIELRLTKWDGQVGEMYCYNNDQDTFACVTISNYFDDASNNVRYEFCIDENNLLFPRIIKLNDTARWEPAVLALIFEAFRPQNDSKMILTPQLIEELKHNNIADTLFNKVLVPGQQVFFVNITNKNETSTKVHVVINSELNLLARDFLIFVTPSQNSKYPLMQKIERI